MTAPSRLGDSQQSSSPAGLQAGHSVILLSLILWRLLIATPDFAGADHLLWHVLLAAGCGLLAWEWHRGWRQALYWGPCGLCFAAVFVAFLPAWLRGAQPSTAAGFGLAIAGQLLFAGYCAQVIHQRRQLAIAAILAGLVVQVALAVGQWWWVLPELSRQLEAGGLRDLVNEQEQHELAERLRNGGSYGSFTLANSLGITLAAGLCLALPWLYRLWQQRDSARWLGLLLPLWLVGGLLLADTKGAWAALAVASTLVGLAYCRPRWRWAGLGFLAGGLLQLILFWPLLEIPSIAVRVGYQIAALQLWQDAPWLGHGWEAFAYQGAQYLPVWAEYARRVHNEVLESLVAGGLLAAIPLIGLMLMLAWPGQRSRGLAAQQHAEDNSQTEAAIPGWLWALPLVLLPLIVVLGTLQSDNLAYWPGAQAGMMLPWTLLLGAAASLTLLLLLHTGAVLGQAQYRGQWAAILVLLLGSLIDFHLHEMAVVCMLIVLSCSGSQLRRLQPASQAGRSGLAAMALAALLLCSAGIHLGQRRAHDLAQAQAIAHGLNNLSDHETRTRLQALLGLPDDLAAEPQALHQFAHDELVHLAGAWPAHEPLLAAAASSHPDPNTRIAALEAHLQRFHPRTGVLSDLAASHAQRREWEAAITRQQQAIDGNPWLLPLRQQLIRYYRAAKQATGSDQEAWAKRIEAEQQRIRELNPQVFSRNRLRDDLE